MQFKRRAMTMLHLQISAVPDEMRYLLSLVAEPLPIVPAHTHKRLELRVTTHAASQTVQGKFTIHGSKFAGASPFAY